MKDHSKYTKYKSIKCGMNSDENTCIWENYFHIEEKVKINIRHT